MVGLRYDSDMFDLSQLSVPQRAFIEMALGSLMRAPYFRTIADKAQAQYGTIRIVDDSDTRADILAHPPTLRLDFRRLEYAYFMATNQTRVPLTLHRVLAHEIYHFAHDKTAMKALIFRFAADDIQNNPMLRERFATTGELNDFMDQMQRFCGYEDKGLFVKALLAEKRPLSRAGLIAALEPPAIRFDNQIMQTLYGEASRSEQAAHYHAGNPYSLQHDAAVLQCSASSEPKPAPCFYRYMPSNSQNAAR